MNIQFCGANRNVTGSRHLITVGDKKVLFDCGFFQGHRKETKVLNDEPVFNPAEVDAIVLSHAHIDHCGELPVMRKLGFKGKIYGTPATCDIVPIMLRDSGHIQEADAERWNRHHKKEDWIEPLYTIIEAEAMDEHFEAIPYHSKKEILPGVTIEFIDAGHILGSAIVVAELEENGNKKKLVYTGDLGRKMLPILKDPEKFGETDILIIESTYGNRLHDELKDVKDKMGKIINETIASGGKIIIPAFALERTQEIVYILHQLHDEKVIPELPVYVDSPLAGRLVDVFKKHMEVFDDEAKHDFINKNHNPFTFTNMHVTASVDESKALNASSVPMIIISASGMCEFGRILHHLKNNISDHRTTVLIVGYMAEGTLGRRLVEGIKLVKIFGDEYPVKAKTIKMNAFSAHADYKEQLDYLSGQKVNQKVFLVHGEDEALEASHKRFTEMNLAPEVIIPEFDSVHEL